VPPPRPATAIKGRLNMNPQENKSPAAQANNSLPTLSVPQSMMLPNTDQWENRFEIHSETSNRIYGIAQNTRLHRMIL